MTPAAAVVVVNCSRDCELTETISLIADDGHYDTQCDALYARAFGPGRHAKAAARLREGNVCRHELSVLAFHDDELVGACRIWPIAGDNGVPALFLGPIAVDKSMRSIGLGRRSVQACLAASETTQKCPVILVGDLSFFGPLGFEIVPPDQICMPGPVDPKRLLWAVAGVQPSRLPGGNLKPAAVQA